MYIFTFTVYAWVTPKQCTKFYPFKSCAGQQSNVLYVFTKAKTSNFVGGVKNRFPKMMSDSPF